MLDIFFEALNYEKIEQKKAYEVAGLLGEDAVAESLIIYPNILPGFIEHVPYTVLLHLLPLSLLMDLLLGDIGGQMGLFIGASVLTILEIFDYLYEVRCTPLCNEHMCRPGLSHSLSGDVQ